MILISTDFFFSGGCLPITFNKNGIRSVNQHILWMFGQNNLILFPYESWIRQLEWGGERLGFSDFYALQPSIILKKNKKFTKRVVISIVSMWLKKIKEDSPIKIMPFFLARNDATSLKNIPFCVVLCYIM